MEASIHCRESWFILFTVLLHIGDVPKKTDNVLNGALQVVVYVYCSKHDLNI